jgi:DNA repair protein RadC
MRFWDVKDSSRACALTSAQTDGLQRPSSRSRFPPLTLRSLSERELLALILREREAIAQAEDLSQKLLQHFGSLCGLSRCSPEELGRFQGVGPARAARICAAFGLAQRLGSESLRRERIDSPERVFALLGVEMRLLRQESLRVILLDTRYQLMRVEEISRGTVNESIAHPRDIFAPVFSAAAFAFVLVHNHPSGDPTPSEADRQLTLQLGKAARLLQVQLLDHVILGSPDNDRTPWFSFKQTGLL